MPGISLALVVATALLRRASRLPVLIIAPLLLTADGILEVIVPVGIPSAGLRASLTEIYWPSADSYSGELPNISRPAFTLSYALAFVVLMRAANPGSRSWLSVITLAALVGFLGLTSSTLAPAVFVLWVGLETVWLIRSRRAGSAWRSDVIRSASGLALAAMLLLRRELLWFYPGRLGDVRSVARRQRALRGPAAARHARPGFRGASPSLA